MGSQRLICIFESIHRTTEPEPLKAVFHELPLNSRYGHEIPDQLHTLANAFPRGASHC